MKTTIRNIFVAVSLLGGLAGWAGTESEVSVAEANVPRAVLEAVTKRFPSAATRSFQKESKAKGLQYEADVALEENGKIRKFTVEVSPLGTILSEEEIITFDELPSVVKDAVRASRHGKGAVETVEREVKDQKTTYEILITGADGKRELVYDARGTLLSEKLERGESGKR